MLEANILYYFSYYQILGTYFVKKEILCNVLWT